MRMWLTIAALIGIVILSAAGIIFVATRSTGPEPIDLRGQTEVSIVLTDKGFEPQRIMISKGTKVTFSSERATRFWPASDPHPSHILYPEFDPKQPIEPGSSWSFVFDRVGSWGYHDHIRSYFGGEIDVDN